jgi:hypothetical protein
MAKTKVTRLEMRSTCIFFELRVAGLEKNLDTIERCDGCFGLDVEGRIRGVSDEFACMFVYESRQVLLPLGTC